MKTFTIGIAGTAKNTGKTTTTSAIMEQIKKNKEICLGLTSIGYDGEDLDNITGLPKPKVMVWPGILVAIAKKCLAVSSAQIEIIEETNIKTPLGNIILGKVKQGGRLVVAGPNKSIELRQVLEKLRHQQANFIIVDGALNRIAPMVEVDGLILTTGAARSSNIKNLARETHSIVEILGYPVTTIQNHALTMRSILNNKAVDELLEHLQSSDSVFINGVMVEKGFNYLLSEERHLESKELVFPDAIKLLVAGDVNKMHNLLTKLKNEQVDVKVQKTIKVIAVTINPYYPEYRFKSDDYIEAHVDKDQLYDVIKQNVPVPVYDIVRQGSEKLTQDILQLWAEQKEKEAAK